MKNFTEERTKEILGRNNYWEEILERDEPRASQCCLDELRTIITEMYPKDLIKLLSIAANTLKENK